MKKKIEKEGESRKNASEKNIMNLPQKLSQDDDFVVFAVYERDLVFKETKFEKSGDAEKGQNRVLYGRIHGQRTPNHATTNLRVERGGWGRRVIW